jgi:hypothetical protein
MRRSNAFSRGGLWSRDILGPMHFRVASIAVVLSVTACVKGSPDEPFSGSATLTWTPVRTDVNGRALQDLAGYRIRYGTSANAMYTIVTVKDPRQTSYVVKDLYPGRWYFAVSAYTTSGAESALSGVASKTIK